MSNCPTLVLQNDNLWHKRTLLYDSKDISPQILTLQIFVIKIFGIIDFDIIDFGLYILVFSPNFQTFSELQKHQNAFRDQNYNLPAPQLAIPANTTKLNKSKRISIIAKYR
jgi:hypothetical protein